MFSLAWLRFNEHKNLEWEGGTPKKNKNSRGCFQREIDAAKIISRKIQDGRGMVAAAQTSSQNKLELQLNYRKIVLNNQLNTSWGKAL